MGTESRRCCKVADYFAAAVIVKGCPPFAENRVCDVSYVQAVFRKKECGCCVATGGFSAEKEAVMLPGNRRFSDKTTPNKWLQSEPVPSPHSSAQARAG